MKWNQIMKWNEIKPKYENNDQKINYKGTFYEENIETKNIEKHYYCLTNSHLIKYQVF